MEATESTESLLLIQDVPRIPARGGSTRIRHFNGATRRTSDWDGLRRDNHMWYDKADCFIYFYSQKTSQRGASLRIPFAAIEHLQCEYLTETCLHRVSYDDEQLNPRYLHIRNESNPEFVKYQLYVPAPSRLAREQAFSYHITTRNLFAYAIGSPLVGERLSSALTDLWTRLRQWKIPVKLSDFTEYLEKQGYADFTENPEHALACLKLAEHARLRDLWIDSFVHCVGMYERLFRSPEFSDLNTATAALLMKATLEMDLHIDRTIKAVGTFLEDELSGENVGLAKPTRDHLDYFRSFLHGFYVNRFGYFPPRSSTPWNKRPWTSMHQDFQNLYEYLADTESSSDWSNTRGLTGGFCVLQNVQSFDIQHGYTSLAHPVPLIPAKPLKAKASTIGLRSLALSKSHAPRGQTMTAKDCLAAASNLDNPTVTRCTLVQEYQRFEREPEALGGKLDMAEARKVRWMLVYSVLQTLKSLVRTPAEVRDSETPSYALCVQTIDCPISEGEDKALCENYNMEERQSSNEKMLVLDTSAALIGPPSPHISIHPDCEADCAEDFFASTNMTRTDSTQSLNSPISPVKRTGSIRNSMHSSVHALQRSVVGSMTRRSSSRRASLTLDLMQPPSCEIVVEDYDDSLQKDADSLDESQLTNMPDERSKSPLDDFDFGFVADGSEPMLQKYRIVDQPLSPTGSIPSPHESDSSGESNRSSYINYRADSPATDLSSVDGFNSRRDSELSLSSLHSDSTKKQRNYYKPSNPNWNNSTERVALNGGTYLPKGLTLDEYEKKRSKRELEELSSYGIVLGKGNVW